MKITAIRTVVEYDGAKMVVINPGDSDELPDAIAQQRIDAGDAKAFGDDDEPEGDGTPSLREQAEEAGYAIEDKAAGWHVITGNDIPADEPVKVQGDAALEATLAELLGPDADADAPVD